MIQLLVNGREYENLKFNTDNMDEVIDSMQEQCHKMNSLIFNNRSLWKISEDGKKLTHETMVSYSEFEITIP